MTWLSLNPNVEPFSRKSAALALTKKGDTKIFKTIDNVSPQELADAYNNAEALGLDIYSLDRKYPEVNPSEETND